MKHLFGLFFAEGFFLAVVDKAEHAALWWSTHWKIGVDWNHVLSSIIETSIVAIFNGGFTALGGLLLIWIIKLVFPKWYKKFSAKKEL
jgi:hypothetical protein